MAPNIRNNSTKRLLRSALAVSAVAMVVGVSGTGFAAPVRKSANASTPISPAGKARWRACSQDEMRQFYAELARKGWRGAQIAAIPTDYLQTNNGIRAVAPRFATFHGDLDADQKPEWVVGCYFPTPTPSGPEPPPMAGMMAGTPMVRRRDDRARLVVFKKQDDGHWRIDWVSPGLGNKFETPEFNMQEVHDGLDDLSSLRLPISLVDIDRDRKLEICYYSWSESPAVGALPGIYRHDGERWVSIAPQADRFSLRDLNRDGKLELVTGSRYIGYGSGDDDVPRVWRWNGRSYQEASADFPGYYEELAERYRKYVNGKVEAGMSIDRAAWDRAIRKAASMGG